MDDDLHTYSIIFLYYRYPFIYASHSSDPAVQRSFLCLFSAIKFVFSYNWGAQVEFPRISWIWIRWQADWDADADAMPSWGWVGSRFRGSCNLGRDCFAALLGPFVIIGIGIGIRLGPWYLVLGTWGSACVYTASADPTEIINGGGCGFGVSSTVHIKIIKFLIECS